MANASTTDEYTIPENDQHKVLYTHCKNVYIERFMEPMMDNMLRIGGKCGADKERQGRCVKEWRNIIKALEENNPQEAMMKFSMHIQNSYEAFKITYKDPEGLFQIDKEVEWL